MVEAVRDMTGHWPSAAVHFEDFGSDKTARVVEQPSIQDMPGAQRRHVGDPCPCLGSRGAPCQRPRDRELL